MTLLTLRHLSISSIQDYLKCPMLWAGRRIFNWGQADNLDMALGRAMHWALSAYHRGQDAELELLTSIDGRGPNKGHGIRKLVPDKQLTDLLAVLGRYQTLQDARPGDRPAIWFEVDIGLPLKFVGEFDLLRADNTIGEWKTGRSTWTQEKVDTEAQATAYHYAYKQREGKLPASMTYHNLVTGGPKTGQVTTFETSRDLVDLEMFEMLCHSAYDGMTTAPLVASCLRSGAQSLGSTPDYGHCAFQPYCRQWHAQDLNELSERYIAWQAAQQAQEFERAIDLGAEIEGILKEHAPEAQSS